MFGIAFFSVLGFPWVCFLMLVRWSGSASMGYVKNVWAKQMLWLPGATVKVEGVENVGTSHSTVFVSNHQSTLDIPALFVALPVDFRFVAKKVLKYVPVTGWYMALAGFVFIDRGNRRNALKSIEVAAEKIRRGTSIVMFPEGTRSETGAILPFKKGPFALAAQAGVPICPVAVEGSRHVMPKNSWNVVPGEIRVKIGAPIDPKPFGDDREALAKFVREKVIALHLEIGGRGGADAAAGSSVLKEAEA
jgi:1-acyl-sn-glycerol-3-phosphate acyltransferase